LAALPAALAFMQTSRGHSSASDLAEARPLPDILRTQEAEVRLLGFGIDRFGKLIVNA